MAKRYARINWQNYPSTATPRNATNLNKMDKGIDDLDNAVETINDNLAHLNFKSYSHESQFGFAIVANTTPYDVLNAMPNMSRFTFAKYAATTFAPTPADGQWVYEFIRSGAGVDYAYATAVYCATGAFYVYSPTTKTWQAK